MQTLLQLFKQLSDKIQLIAEKYWRNQHVLLFVFFLFLSSTFWFLNSMRKIYTTTISYPVKFENLPDDKLISGDLPESINLVVRGTGFILMRYKFTNKFLSFPFDFKKMKRFSHGHRKGAYLLTNDYEQRISAELNKEIELLDIEPDTFFIGLMNKKMKVLPVKLEMDVNYLESYHQSGPIIIKPETVEASGPDIVIDTLTQIHTVKSIFNNVNDTIKKNVRLETLDKVEFSENKVEVTVPVESFTESKFKIPILVTGLPENYIIKTFPSEIDLSCLVAISQFEKVNEEQFIAIVDVSDINLEKQSRLKVKLTASPDFVYSINYEPKFVDFLIERSY